MYNRDMLIWKIVLHRHTPKQAHIRHHNDAPMCCGTHQRVGSSTTLAGMGCCCWWRLGVSEGTFAGATALSLTCAPCPSTRGSVEGQQTSYSSTSRTQHTSRESVLLLMVMRRARMRPFLMLQDGGPSPESLVWASPQVS
jgi:hypothetical protein